jgi:Ca2+/H+ antiporter, TMEM165/GDT1 family
MAINWAHAGSSFLASFLACLVECVEALTVVLAVGSVRGWSGALSGASVAVALLLGMVVVLGRTLTHFPLHTLQLIVGVLLLLFGLRWLLKAVLRSAGQIPLHDEQAAFAKSAASMRRLDGERGWDRVAFGSAFHITMLEGIEIVFIVIAVSAGGPGLLPAASLGALAALVLVILLGLALHRPLAAVPENTLKFAVGVLLSAFGTFWTGEGAGLYWPGADWSLAGLVAGYLIVALSTVSLCKARPSAVSY